jgi:DNA polymerase IV
VRLEGLAGSAGSARQPALDEPEHTWRDAEVAADAVWARFGRGAVGPASLVSAPPPAAEQRHPDDLGAAQRSGLGPDVVA